MKQLELEKVLVEENIMHMQTARAGKDPGDDDYIICAICTAARVQDDIESVDSVCRDSADTQYMLIQKNFSESPKQLTYKPL